MAMQILYAKDTLNDMRRIKQSGTETISLFADTLGEIKEIRGFIYYPVQTSAQSILTDRISLMRYHATDTLFNADKESLKPTDDKAVKKDTVLSKPAEVKEQDVEQNNARRPEMRPRPRLRQTTEK